MDDDLFPDHKLCGFFRAVLAVTPPPNANLTTTLSRNARCYIFGDGPDVCFRTDDDVVLSPIKPKPEFSETQNSEGERPSKTDNCSSKKKWSRIGMVNGSLSVVYQLHALIIHKCVKVSARVVKVEAKEYGEVRALVLVDIYLSIDLWSGWQFPRSGSVAAALFRHLSCDWGTRRLILEYDKPENNDGDSIWNISDCHVLGCKQHCSTPDTYKKKLFELHEIFKSLPAITKGESCTSRIYPRDYSCESGIWMMSDDVLINILAALGPIDLVRISASCHHFRVLAASIMPYMKLKLFPHQQAAVEWMLKREKASELLPHPLYMSFLTEDGFSFHMNAVSGEIVTGTVPTVRDFHGGMFCDEPGLGKTITALSLILKTQGTSADPPDGVNVIWCTHNTDQRCGYYELSGDTANSGRVLSGNGVVSQSPRRGQLSLEKVTPRKDLSSTILDRSRFQDSAVGSAGSAYSCPRVVMKLATNSTSMPATCAARYTRSFSCIKRNLVHEYESLSEENQVIKRSKKIKNSLNGPRSNSRVRQYGRSHGSTNDNKRLEETIAHYSEHNETWVQCDACHKWRRLTDGSVADANSVWFCSMNSDPLHQNCSVPEESWDYKQSIKYLPGFHTKGTTGGDDENVTFFTSVLKEHYQLMNSETKKALTWLAKLSSEKLSEMETVGLIHPLTGTELVLNEDARLFPKIFQGFGLIKQVEKSITRWFYPRNLVNLAFDLAALRIALCKPLDSRRLYLSRATLVVVPSNLVDHWKTQIQNHVRPGQLRVYLWTDHRQPRAHSLAWDYDVVITTFNRLSAEWSPRDRSVLQQIHWLRVILDEGHTLGSSLALTNKLQMAVSLAASNRWLLTGTPTPNTPNSQLSHLQPLLKFLHEEVYGHNQKSWEAGVLRPFEAEMEEGRLRLLQLLHRCMISARKVDLRTIPPCIKKVTYLNFMEEHARSYNELVVTVQRNILMADWNDPSHVESLLNPKQWKFRVTTIRNVRLSCCVAGHVKVVDAGQDIQETMDILVEKGLDPVSEEYAFIKHNLLYGGNCMRCNEWCRLPVITPCRHILCLDCVALDSERCSLPGCGNSYEMQSPEILTRPENPNPKWPVPKDLIELQPSYKQDDWHPDWQLTSSSKVAYLVHRLKKIEEANKNIGLMDEANDAKDIDQHHLISQHTDISISCESSGRAGKRACQMPPEKVLIFSQFLEHIHVIEQQLTVAGIKFTGMYSPMHSSNKMKSLATFQDDTDCMALLMDGSAALGLDLSFVTHVFLMEPIWDKSMEEQVISRAHRMGATRPIHVETLAMRGTIEEQMLKFLQDADDCRKFLKEEFGKHEQEKSRAHRTLHDFAESNYLSQLSFVHTYSKS